MKFDVSSFIQALRLRTLSLIQKIRTDRRAAIIALAVIVAFATAIFFFIRWVNSRIRAEGERVQVQITRLRAPSTDGLTVYLNSGDVRATEAYRGGQFLATSGGLVELDEGGSVKRRYTTSDGLPENDLTSLAVFRDRL